MLNAELVQVIPGVDAALVTVREFRADRVMADLLDFGDGHLALADLQRLLARAVAAYFSRGRIDAQKLVRQAKARAVGERELHRPRGLVKLDLCGNRRAGIEAGHGRVLYPHVSGGFAEVVQRAANARQAFPCAAPTVTGGVVRESWVDSRDRAGTRRSGACGAWDAGRAFAAMRPLAPVY